MRACSYYIATVTATKECSVNPSISSTCMTNRVVAYVIAIAMYKLAIAFVLFTRTSMMEFGRASSVVGGHFRKQKGFR